MKGSILLPILKSHTQADLLALLYLNPGKEYSITEIARRIDSSVPGVHHEVVRLLATNYIQERREGNSRLLKAASDSIITQALTLLLAATHGPLPVISNLLDEISGIDQAYIFGSWAARYAGDLGPIPSEVDLLVVGTVDLDKLDTVAREAAAILGRKVNTVCLSQKSWQNDNSEFLDTLRSNPLLNIINPTKAASSDQNLAGK